MKQSIREWASALITAGVVAAVVLQFIAPTVVTGESMEPAFHDRDYLIVSKQAYNSHRKPERGDVVIFHSHLKDENHENKDLIKRIIAVPGETVSVSGGKIYINGETFADKYAKEGVTSGFVAPVQVPEGYYFCLGDNRLHSTDSRVMEVGLVSEDEITGKAVFRVFPLKKAGIVKK